MSEENSSLGQLNVKIPQEHYAPIDGWLEKSGYTKWKAAVAAFRLLRLAPPDLKDLAMSGDDAAVRGWFRAAVRATVQTQAIEHVEQMLQRLSKSRSDDRPKASGGSGQ